MRFLASPLAVVCATVAVGAATGRVSALSWPESGVIKVSGAKSPSHLSISLDKCLELSLNWGDNKVIVKEANNDGAEATSVKGVRMLPGGGKFVALLMLEDKSMNVVVNAEQEGGNLSSHTLRLSYAECPMTTLTISSKDGNKDLDGVHVSVSEEVEVALRQARNPEAEHY